jgi:hypothetical protein
MRGLGNEAPHTLVWRPSRPWAQFHANAWCWVCETSESMAAGLERRSPRQWFPSCAIFFVSGNGFLSGGLGNEAPTVFTALFSVAAALRRG